jgi:acyl-CoA thioester hydrolase
MNVEYAGETRSSLITPHRTGAKPSRFDDSLQVTVEPVKVGAGQIVVAAGTMRADALLAAADVRQAWVNAAAFRPVGIPQAIIIKTGTIS